MPLTTYTSGQVLTASSLNANLSFASTNGGLVLVKTQTIGSAVAAVTVTGAFSSDYDNYLVLVSGGVASTSQLLYLTLGSTATGYYFTFDKLTWAGVSTRSGFANQTRFDLSGGASANGLISSVLLLGPNLAKRTAVFSQQTVMDTGDAVYTSGGFLNDATQYTAFTYTLGGGTMTGGTIAVYGYAKA